MMERATWAYRSRVRGSIWFLTALMFAERLASIAASWTNGTRDVVGPAGGRVSGLHDGLSAESEDSQLRAWIDRLPVSIGGIIISFERFRAMCGVVIEPPAVDHPRLPADPASKTGDRVHQA